MDLNEILKGVIQQGQQFTDKVGLGLSKAGQTIGQDAARGAEILNDPRNSWIGMNPVGKAAATGMGGLGVLLGQMGKHELPVVGLNLGKQAESQSAKNYKNWFEQVGIRHQQEQEGMAILDDLDEMGRTPKQVHDDFFTQTYPQLPPEAQERFHKMIKNLTSYYPGKPIGTLAEDGTEEVVKGWDDILVYLPDTAGYLEGGEKGLIALMEMANQRYKPTKRPGLGLEDGKTITIVPGATP